MPSCLVDFFNSPSIVVVFGFLTSISLIFNFIVGSRLFNVSALFLYKTSRAMLLKKISIMSNDEKTIEQFKRILVRSKLIKERNIEIIRSNMLEHVKDSSMIILDWKTFGNDIDEVFKMRKGPNVNVVIYARPREIDEKIMAKVLEREEVIIVNSKGRLLNDVVISLISSSSD